MLDGRPLVDVHLHPPRLPTLKPSWGTGRSDFGDRAVLDRVYDAEAPSCRPGSPPTWPPTAWTSPCCSASTARKPPASSRRGPAADRRAQPDRLKFIANLNPHLHYPVDEELERQLGLGAVALKIHPVHAGAAANERALYPAYEICQSAGIPVVVHCGTFVPRLVQRPGRPDAAGRRAA